MVEDKAIASQIDEIHEFAAYVLIGLAVFHPMAALWHHVVRKDDVLKHMLPPQ
jgi:cytochrome b561